MKTIKHLHCLFILSGIALISACTKKDGPKLTIYTSIYKEVIALYEPELAKAFPGLKIDWYQAGSENVAARVLAETQGGGVKADLLISSDIFFYQELKKQGHLQAITAPNISLLDPAYVDSDKMFAVTRFPVMVIAINTRKIEAKDRPKGFKDLLDPRFKDKLTMPSPLESGTALASSLYFSHMFGDSFFEGIRKNNILASGGNGATLSRVQSGEKPIGIVLMENVLQAKEKGNDWVEFIVPEEGALAIPSPMAIFKNSQAPELANQVFNWFLAKESQQILIKGWIYAPYADAPTPPGAPDWASLKKYPWDLKTLEQWGLERQNIKDRFQKVVLK